MFDELGGLRVGGSPRKCGLVVFDRDKIEAFALAHARPAGSMTTRDVAIRLGVSESRVRQMDGVLAPKRALPRCHGDRRFYSPQIVERFAIERDRRDAAGAVFDRAVAR